jgi:hypothetical protein
MLEKIKRHHYPHAFYQRILSLYAKFNVRWVWDLPNAKERLSPFEDNTTESNRIRDELRKRIEIKLGRMKTS